MQAPRLRTSWTSRRRSAEKRPRTLGLAGFVELPNSLTNPLAWVLGFMAIGRGKDAARCVGVAAVNEGSCSCKLSKRICSWCVSGWFHWFIFISPLSSMESPCGTISLADAAIIDNCDWRALEAESGVIEWSPSGGDMELWSPEVWLGRAGMVGWLDDWGVPAH